MKKPSFRDSILWPKHAPQKSGPMVIAEVAQAHDGSLGFAHAFIDVAQKAGADAIKFQTHIAHAESHPSEPWRVKFSKQDESRYAYWQRMEFSESQWRGLKKHADEAGLLFLSSAFSCEAIELLERLEMQIWKVASGEVNNLPLLDQMCRGGKPILLSSGMSRYEELAVSIARVQEHKNPVAIMQCTSQYPSPPEHIGLNVVPEFIERFGIPVGFSDHSGTIFPGLSAATLGAEIIEVHLTLSRDAFGPDVVASITPEELRVLCEGVSFIGRALDNPVNKDTMVDENMGELRALFTKSLAYTSALQAGEVLTEAHLDGKKPGTGVPVAQLWDYTGKTLKVSVEAGELLQEAHLQ